MKSTAKQLARAAANSAIRRGELSRQPCEKCGAPESQAHHDDYSRPLDVRWLCSDCHQELHLGPRPEPKDRSQVKVFHMNLSEYMDVPKAAGRLGISRQRVLQLIDAGQLDGELVNPHCWMVKEDSVNRRLAGEKGRPGRPRRSPPEVSE